MGFYTDIVKNITNNENILINRFFEWFIRKFSAFDKIIEDNIGI